MTTPKTSRVDAYSNAITGLGGGVDKSSFSFFNARPDLPAGMLADMYEKDALSARIVDRLPDDATRQGFYLEGVDESFDVNALMSEVEDLKVMESLADAWRWSRLFGGAVAILAVNDGNKMEEPLDLTRVTKLSAIQVMESTYVTPSGFNPGLGARAFASPEFYDITVPFGAADNRLRRVHHSRVIRFDGVRVSRMRLMRNNGWGPSILDRVFTELDQLGSVMGYARSVMHDISITVFKLEGWREQLAGDERSQAEAQRALESLRMSMDNLHAMALDSADEFVNINRNVSGLKDLIQEFIDALVRSTDMPRTVLLGEQPSGLNASGDSEVRSWFDFVRSQQKLHLAPAINRVLDVLFASKKRRPTEWEVEFPPLWQPSDAEKADTLLKNAQAGQILILNDVAAPDEIREQLIATGDLTPLSAPRDVGEVEEDEVEMEEEAEDGNA